LRRRMLSSTDPNRDPNMAADRCRFTWPAVVPEP
jgi:hypothetical protein